MTAWVGSKKVLGALASRPLAPVPPQWHPRAMNYRHTFHAGNFADVVKHAVLALLIERLKAKATAFRVIDTHAGAGLYDLAGEQARRTDEWKGGIGRLLGKSPDPSLAALLSPYLSAVEAAQTLAPPGPDHSPRLYPGSPWIARHLLRPQDRLTAVELHPEDAASLSQLFAGDRQVKVIALDGWNALGAFVPPKERRGLVLIDPPFEERDEFDRLLAGLVKAHRRWPTGVYALWYPGQGSRRDETLPRRPCRSRAAAVAARRAHHPQADAGPLQRHRPRHRQPAVAVRGIAPRGPC